MELMGDPGSCFRDLLGPVPAIAEVPSPLWLLQGRGAGVVPGGRDLVLPCLLCSTGLIPGKQREAGGRAGAAGAGGVHPGVAALQLCLQRDAGSLWPGPTLPEEQERGARC